MGRLKAMPPLIGSMKAKVQFAPKMAEPFYQSREWRQLVASIKRERGSRCEEAGCGSTNRVIADHIVERKDGGAELDRSNIMLRCAACHQRKTAVARRMRAQGQVYR